MPNDLIPVGSKVTATLSLDAASQGSAELYIVDQDDHDETEVAPASQASVSITPQQEGQLRVVVTADPGTRGELTVVPGGVTDRPTDGNHEERFTVADMGG